jgi:hypothetical protein
MKFKADIHLNMRTPELEAPEDMTETAIKLWLLTELKMLPNMVKAISIDKIIKVERP